ncbi:MAG TPA: hypothetical protein VF405_12535 [Gammaproteobacteria bacterium]
MRPRILVPSAAALLLWLTHAAVAQEPTIDEKLDQVKDSLARIAAANMKGADVHETNGFRVESSDNAELGADFKPNGNRFQGLSITSPGVFHALVEKGRPSSQGGSIGAYHRESGKPMLVAWDSDGDGRLNGVEYSTMDEKGNALVTVIDYEADGQPDLRMHLADNYSEIWHADRWYRIEKRGERRGVMLNGEFVDLEQRDNRPFVPER